MFIQVQTLIAMNKINIVLKIIVLIFKNLLIKFNEKKLKNRYNF